MRSKIRGMFLGIAVGDALGMPVETFSAAQIKRRFGKVTKYLRPIGHKWFSNRLEGTWTDDTQLSLAIARSLINQGKIDLDDLALEHVKELGRGNLGWGGSTRDAVIKIASGTHWSQSGIPDKPGRGLGNGVVMKISPIGAYFTLRLDKISAENARSVSQLTSMTHATNMAIVSAFAHIAAINYCLTHSDSNFSRKEFLRHIIDTVRPINNPVLDIRSGVKDDLFNTLILLDDLDYDKIDQKQLIKLFGGGSCYVFHSLPFSYAFFLRNPGSIRALYDVINAGGDTDSNGSIVGSLLGALSGHSLFGRKLTEKLWRKDEIVKVADLFHKTFKTNKTNGV